VGALTLVDPDNVEEHNRPRLRGCERKDVGRPKVEALADLLRRTRGGSVEALALPIEDSRARDGVAAANLIVSATDTLSSRLVADRLARRTLLPLVDAGINIQVGVGGVDRIGGRVSVSWPDGPCLSCMDVINPDALAAEADPIGYRGLGVEDAPSVAAFNAVVASLAVAETLDLLVDFRRAEPRSRDIRYDGLRPRVTEIAVPEPNTCGACGDLRGNVAGTLAL
jgi:molybdopterin/thiamine biosynthesis adenylyltransferase